jgi:hypothetical protein
MENRCSGLRFLGGHQTQQLPKRPKACRHRSKTINIAINIAIASITSLSNVSKVSHTMKFRVEGYGKATQSIREVAGHSEASQWHRYS